MKRWGLSIIAVIVILLAILFLIGPRLDTDLTIETIDLPADLDTYLATSEAQFTDLVAGTEKTIVWANPETHDRTDLAVIYLHGFSATRQETAPLSDMVAATLGANLYYDRLTGHGRSGQALAEATVNDWANDVVEAVDIGRAIGDKVVLIGTSTGGSLALWYAASAYAGDDIAALILISPNLGPANPASELLLWPWGKQIARMVIGAERGWEGENADHETYWTNRYPTEALMPMMGSVELARQVDPSQLQAPVMVIYSPLDPNIDTTKVEELFAGLAGSQHRLLPLENPETASNHVLAGDILSPHTTEYLAAEIAAFVNR